MLKMLIELPQKASKYNIAYYYVTAAKELGWPVNYLTRTLNERNGRPVRYWRVGTSDGAKCRIQLNLSANLTKIPNMFVG